MGGRMKMLDLPLMAYFHTMSCYELVWK